MENSNKISNPLQRKCIYRVTTSCHKNIKGVWSYKAKIFFRKEQTQAVQELTSTSFKKLITEVQVRMSEIVKQQAEK